MSRETEDNDCIVCCGRGKFANGNFCMFCQGSGKDTKVAELNITVVAATTPTKDMFRKPLRVEEILHARFTTPAHLHSQTESAFLGDLERSWRFWSNSDNGNDK